MKAIDLMTRDVACCSEHDTLNQAAQLMWERDIGCLPVVDDGNTLVGMITDRDICMAAYTQGNSLDRLRVSSAMARDVATCEAETPVYMIEAVMRDKQIRRMPVVRLGSVIGLVSLNDIARAASTRSNGVSLDEVGQTLAAVCQPREAKTPAPGRRARAA